MKKKTVHIFFSAAITLFVFLVSLSGVYAAEEYELFIAQGIQKLNEEKYDEALELLDKALEMAPDNIEAIYYSAVANSRLGKMDQAEDLLKKIEKDDKRVASVYYELGRIYYAKGNCRKAERNLKQYMQYAEDPAVRESAANMINDCYGRAEEKPYKVNLTAGYQYDTNVVLEPNNPSITEDRKRDGRFVGLINAGARLYENDTVTVRGDYNLYQSFHLDLHDFDTHYQKISPSIELTALDIITPSAGYSLEYMFFDDDEYGVIHTYFVKVNIEETENLSTDGIYEYKDIKYWDTEHFTDNSIRTGRMSSVGVKQNFSFGAFKGDVYYFYDSKRAREAYWAYLGYRIGGDASYQIINPLLVKASAEFNRRGHRDDFPAYGELRIDKMEKYSIKFHYAITSKLTATLSETYTLNDSNIADYHYERNMIGLFLTYGLI